LIQFEFETFNSFVTLTIVANDFDSRFFASVEFVLSKYDLGGATSASHAPNSSNNIIEL